jgi:hypothetical protein
MQTYSNDGAEFEAAALASKPSRTLAIRRPIRVWNGIFAARDRRAKRDLMTMSPRRDRESETTGRGKGYFQPCPHPNQSAGPKPRLLIIPPACHENQRLRQIPCLNIDRHCAARGSAPVDSMSSINFRTRDCSCWAIEIILTWLIVPIMQAGSTTEISTQPSRCS